MFETPSDTSSDFEKPLTRVSVVKPARRTPLPNPEISKSCLYEMYYTARSFTFSLKTRGSQELALYCSPDLYRQ